ncbi:MAG: hypothetical protein ABIO45_16410 [Burkholderiaceae bacterium]
MKHSMLRRSIAALLASLVTLAVAQESLRPEVGKPLQAAHDLVKAGRYKEALAKIRDADAVGGKSANENFVIERMRMAAASGAGDADTAARSYDAISGSSKISASDKLKMVESIAGSYYRAREYSKSMQWSQRYFRDGGTSPAIRTMLIQSQYLGGDFAGAAKELNAEVAATEKAGGTPGEDRLKLLLNAALKLNDTNGYVHAVEKLVTYYPKKEYWVDLLSRLQRKSNFSDRFALDVYRLSLATGSMSAPGDFMEMAQLALQAGFPFEARQVLDKGFGAKILGLGADAARQQRLRDLVQKTLDEDKKTLVADESQARSAKDGTALVNVGMNQVFNGEKAKGLDLMQQGIAKGNLKRTEDAKLHLGVAQVQAGDNAKALASFKSVGGSDGSADLARLWALHLRRKA